MLFLFPTSFEAEPFRRLCPDAEVVISGVGMAATAATLVSLCASRGLVEGECVVLAGLAGAYTDAVAKGEVVEVVEERTIELPERFRECYKNDAMTSLRAVRSNSVHRPVADGEGADIENMEGATLFAVGAKLGLRCAEIRSISNFVGEQFPEWSVDLALNNLARELKNQFIDK